MATPELIKAVNGYEDYYKRKGIDEKLVDAYIMAAGTALCEEKDVENGLKISKRAKKFLGELLMRQTNGGSFKTLEEYAQENKTQYEVIDKYYELLLYEAPYSLDSYMLYIEKNRLRKDRFYEPRRKTLIKVTNELQALEDNKLDELFLHCPARTGKLIADDVPVFTSDGWKKHGDLKVGDKVIGSDGNYTEVIQVHPKHHTTHTVTLSDGTKIDCHANHEWTVFDRRGATMHTYETHEMIKRLYVKEKNKHGEIADRRNLYLPLRKPMVGEHKHFELSPYVLGAWLGDGTNMKPCITDPESDRAIIDKIIESGFELKNVYTHKITGVKTFVFGSDFLKAFQKYEMCFRNKKCEKHIPVEYLTADIEQRLELLAGLLDTDGTLCKKEHRYHFSTISDRLKDDFVTLINSFGWRVCVTKYKPHTSSFGITGKHDCWVISFNPTMYIPCVLERKQLTTFSEQRRISVVDIQESEHKSGNCITVSNPDGLYAVGTNMNLTHNSQEITMYSTWHCARNTELSNLYVTYKEGLGGAFIDGVTEIYTDPTYAFKDVFPNVKIVDTDAKNHKMDLNRKKKYKTLSGKGLESGLNGEYDAYGVLILDDILEGIQDVLSPDVLHRKQLIFDNNVMMRKKEQCKIIYNGTIWSLHDLYMDRLHFLEESEDAKHIRYKVLKIPALDPDTDESNFDYDYGVGFTTQYYRTLRSKFESNDDMAGWWSQCQQEPIERDGAVFNPKAMNYYNGVLPEEPPLKIIGHCDSALGGGDYLSFPIAYVYEDGRMFLVDVVFDNSEKHVTEPQIISMIKKHNMKNVHFESNQGGEGIKDDVERALREDKTFNGGKPINITSSWAQSDKRKSQRIFDHAEAIRQIYFLDPAHRDAQYQKFMQNLFSFTLNMSKKAHDDAPDSLAGLIDFEIHGSGMATVQAVMNPFRGGGRRR